MRNKLLKTTTLVSLTTTLVVLVVSFAAMTLGQSQQSQFCQTEFAASAAREFVIFEDEMKAISQNTQVVTEQLDAAFGAYRDLQSNLNERLSIAEAGIDTSSDFVGNITGIEQCRNVVRNLQNSGRDVLSTFMRKTAVRKQSLALVEQYQALIGNSERLVDELRDLNGNLTDFAERVPCFSEVCVNR